MPSTIRLHRVFKTTPERLYKAFINPEAMVKTASMAARPAPSPRRSRSAR